MATAAQVTRYERALRHLSECAVLCEIAADGNSLSGWKEVGSLFRIFISSQDNYTHSETYYNLWTTHRGFLRGDDQLQSWHELPQTSKGPHREAVASWRLDALVHFCELYKELRTLKVALFQNQLARFRLMLDFSKHARSASAFASASATAVSPSAAARMSGPGPTETELQRLEQEEEGLATRLHAVREYERLIRTRCETAIGSGLLVVECNERSRVRFIRRQIIHLEAEIERLRRTDATTAKSSDSLSVVSTLRSALAELVGVRSKRVA